MFEILLIERVKKENILFSSMIAVADHDVDRYVEGIVQEEEACVSTGILAAYTLTVVHTPDKEVPLNYSPAPVMEVNLS